MSASIQAGWNAAGLVELTALCGDQIVLLTLSPRTAEQLAADIVQAVAEARQLIAAG